MSYYRVYVAAAAALLLGVVALRYWPAPTDRQYLRPLSVSATQYAQHDIDVDGVRLRYIDVGPRAAATVLLLPGHTSRIEEYDALIPLLSQTFRVLVFDFPGSGYSEKPVRDYSLTYYEETVIAFMDALGVRRAHLAGGSLGANVLLGVAARYPQRVDRLALWSPGSAWPARPWLARAGHVLVAGYLPFRLTVNIQSTYWYSADFPGRAAALRDTFEYYDEVMSPGFVAMYWGLALDTLGRSLFDIASQVSQPTLLCYGGQDTTPFMREGVPKLYGLLPRSESCFYPRASHALATEIPEQLAAKMYAFLTRPAR